MCCQHLLFNVDKDVIAFDQALKESGYMAEESKSHAPADIPNAADIILSKQVEKREQAAIKELDQILEEQEK